MRVRSRSSAPREEEMESTMLNDRSPGLRHGGVRVGVVTCLLASGAFGADAEREEIPNPFPRQVNRVEKVREWTFGRGTAGWRAVHHCTLEARDGKLAITCTGNDPYLQIPAPTAAGHVLLKLRARCSTEGGGQFFFVTDQAPTWSERQSQRFDLKHDGKWHDYEVRFRAPGKLVSLRLDPGSGEGLVEVERLELHRMALHPLEIVSVRQAGELVTALVRNHGDGPRTVESGGKQTVIKAGATGEVSATHRPAKPFETAAVKITCPGLTDLRRAVWRCNPGVAAEWVARKSGRLAMRIAPDGSGAWVDLDGRCVAAISPIVEADGLGKLSVRAVADGVALRADGLKARLAFRADDGEIAFSLESTRPCRGPVVRVLGPLEQGLFAGLEYLGKGERSSSKLDIETAESLRYAPDPLKVTMPLMACCTPRASVAISWKDMTLRPSFASPNFLDGTDGHRMALEGAAIDATIRVRPPGPLEEAILWAVGKIGLPDLPAPPRTRQQQGELALRALAGPISGDGGWGHCAEARWARQPFADVASTIWRLTGKAPKLDRLVPGGAHVRNDAIYFVTGRTDEWLKMRGNQARGTIRRQRPDGSFRYEGKYRRGHFEDTASGFCARPAYELLEYARLTGDGDALAAGLKTLEYMKRFRTPRGAQVWELSLHTPDILANAYLVAAYVRGYELTGKPGHLAQARRWAISGIPFVYLWGRYPIMRYATVPVYGATNWRAPNWIGLPVQWCGGVYAYFLTELARHDKTFDWHNLAEGILLAGEQMQYPDGKLAGCLPDVFHLPDQRRAGPSINPCALASLRLAVEGKWDALTVATAGKHRVCSPWPVSIEDGQARIRAQAGTRYQLLVDGKRIVHVPRSKGRDVILLE